METIFSVGKFYVDYEYPECSSYNVVGSFRNLEDAREALHNYVRDYYESGDFESDEEFESFLNEHYSSKDCFMDERETQYFEVNIIETELK